MKFAKILKTEAVPEWKKQYIDYKGLKKVLRLIDRAHLTQQEEHAYNYGGFFRKMNNEHARPSPVVESPYPEIPPPTYSQGPVPDTDPDNNHAFGVTSLTDVARPILNRMSARMMSLTKRGSYGTPVYHPNDPHNHITLETLLDQVNEHERKFFVKLDGELRKIEKFYTIKEKETETNLRILKRQLQEMKDIRKLKHRKKSNRRGTWSVFVKQSFDILTMAEQSRESKGDHTKQQAIDYKASRRKLKKAVFEFYRGIELLRKYRNLNKTGFAKILKKFDKVAKWTGSAVYIPKVEQAQFVSSKNLEAIIKETENLYIENFEAGMRRQAMQKLRLPNNANKSYHAVTWRTGLNIGIALAMLGHGIKLAIEKHHDYKGMSYILQVYGGFGMPVFFSLLFGVNMYVWTHSHINYKFIFELDPRDNLDYRQFYEIPSILLLLLCTAFYFSFTFWSEATLFPLLFLIGFLALLFCPFPIFYYDARRWLIVAIVRLFASGFVGVEFRDFFLADILNSLSYTFATIGLFGCICKNSLDELASDNQTCNMKLKWYAVALYILPPWWRLLQCLRRCMDTRMLFPHMLNAGKYLSTIMAAILLETYRIQANKGDLASSLRGVWIFVQTISSVYTSWWDVFMDWSLLQRADDDNIADTRFQFRKDLGFKRKWIYQSAIISNTMMRFSWVSILHNTLSGQPYLYFGLALVEMLRRWQWNFFRVENEHINNCGVHRAVKDISVYLDVSSPVRDETRASSPSTPTVPSRRQSFTHRLWAYLPAIRPAEARDFEPRQDAAATPVMGLFGDDDYDDDDDDDYEDFDDDDDYDDNYNDNYNDHDGLDYDEDNGLGNGDDIIITPNKKASMEVEEIELEERVPHEQQGQQGVNSANVNQPLEDNGAGTNWTTVTSFRNSSPASIARRRPVSLESMVDEESGSENFVVVPGNNDYNSRRILFGKQEPPSLPPSPSSAQALLNALQLPSTASNKDPETGETKKDTSTSTRRTRHSMF